MITNQIRYRLRISLATMLTGTLLSPVLAHADVTYQETTQITGGSMVGMLKMVGAFSSQARQLNGPMTNKVMIHGGRMVRSGLHLTQIIDLDGQTITEINHDKHSYSVMTFEQLQQQMNNLTKQAKGTASPDSPAAQMSFNAHITSSGATREVDGQTATESLLNVSMTATQAEAKKAGIAALIELWSVDSVPGLEELRVFNQRLSKELSVQAAASPIAALLSSQPGGAQAVAELKKESSKMSGFPVLQVTRVGLTVDGQPLPPPSAAPLTQKDKDGESSAAASITKEIATGTATQTANDQIARLGTFGRALSGSAMGSLMHHPKKTTQTVSTPSSTGTPDPTAAVLLESLTRASGFSVAPVEATALEVPAGYKQTAAPHQSR